MFKSFVVRHPTTASEASRELELLGEEATIYAGGTELLMLMRHGLIRPRTLVNIKQIQGLDTVIWNEGRVRIGACVTHRRLETDPIIKQHLPMLGYAERQVANVRVRVQGTVGGNLCFADPHSDPGTALLVYNAIAKLGSKNSIRDVPLREFCLGMYETILQPTELLLHIDVPVLPAGWGSAYLKVHRLQRPTLGTAAAANLVMGKIAEVRLSVGCVGPKPERLDELEFKLRGASLHNAKEIIGDSANYLKELLKPVDDILGSISYKLHITQVLLFRALAEATRQQAQKANGYV